MKISNFTQKCFLYMNANDRNKQKAKTFSYTDLKRGVLNVRGNTNFYCFLSMFNFFFLFHIKGRCIKNPLHNKI